MDSLRRELDCSGAIFAVSEGPAQPLGSAVAMNAATMLPTGYRMRTRAPTLR